jgi:hypothetical protein
MRINYTLPALIILSMLIGGAIGSAEGSSRAVKDTLKLCNQKPHECRFKYDILMYDEVGRVPYPDPTKIKPQPQPEKK